jgi:ribose-phosphate pyrophosphokinase
MIKINGKIITVNHFPDGTQRLNMSEELSEMLMPEKSQVFIVWNYENDAEMATLMFVKRHIDEHAYGLCHVNLMMPYVPNGRMDRVKNGKEIFTLKYFCEFINYLNFNSVFILDPHSDVTTALINKVVVINPSNYIDRIFEDIELQDETSIYKGTTIVYFPDNGAMKRYKDLPCFNGRKIIYGEKDRDWETGEIRGLKIYTQNGERIDGNANKPLEGNTVLMIDDIISYGGTLAFSADKIKELGANAIYAYASHAENSMHDENKGTIMKRVENRTIDEIFTTNSIYSKGDSKYITIIGEF